VKLIADFGMRNTDFIKKLLKLSYLYSPIIPAQTTDHQKILLETEQSFGEYPNLSGQLCGRG
jgi:hypothetical protein